MSELKFANTKWDARTWTQEQKIKWQEKAFELGYTLCGGTKPDYHPLWDFFFLEDDKTMTRTSNCETFYLARESTLNFEDMFPEEEVIQEPEVETKHSVFTHPRWVTASTTLQADGGLGTTSITEGKDYKVIDINFCNKEIYQYSLRNDEGVIELYHVSHFYEVTPEECTYMTPVEIETEECDGFDNLVYVDPSVGHNTMAYFVILKESCSESQWKYCQNNLPIATGNYGSYATLQICNDGDGWFDNDSVDDSDIMVSFNDIFKEVN